MVMVGTEMEDLLMNDSKVSYNHSYIELNSKFNYEP